MKSRELRAHTTEQLRELKFSLQRELLCFLSVLAMSADRSVSRSRKRRVLARVLTKLNNESIQKG